MIRKQAARKRWKHTGRKNCIVPFLCSSRTSMGICCCRRERKGNTIPPVCGAMPAVLSNLAEYELDHVFLAQYEGELHPDPEEVGDLRWISIFELKKELEEHPERFAAWFQIAAPRVLDNSFRVWWD